MTVLEQRFMEMLSHELQRLVKQLEIMNKLKALELKGRVDLSITPGTVDDIVEG